MFFSLLSCREALAQLDDYLDRELSAREIVLVERHLKICRHCARRFAEEARFIEEMRAKLERLEAPAGLLDKVMDSLPDEANR